MKSENNVKMENVKKFHLQRVESVKSTGATIPQVVEMVTHRWLSGATERYLRTKYGVDREWIEATARKGCNTIIDRQREELARLRASMRHAA